MSVFDTIVDTAERWHNSEFVIQMLVPWPGTPAFDKLDKEGRLHTYDWSRYNNLEVIFRPKQMSADEMAEAHLQACNAIRQIRSG